MTWDKAFLTPRVKLEVAPTWECRGDNAAVGSYFLLLSLRAQHETPQLAGTYQSGRQGFPMSSYPKGTSDCCSGPTGCSGSCFSTAEPSIASMEKCLVYDLLPVRIDLMDQNWFDGPLSSFGTQQLPMFIREIGGT